MAKMDHYKNGEWVGSTEIEGHSNTTGWVNTYSADGNVRSTWVANTDTFDYKPEQHPPKSIEEIQNERAGRKILTEMTDKAFKPVMILGIVAIIAEIVVGIVYMIKNYGVKATFDSIVDCVTMIVSELFIAEFIDENGNIEVIVWIILILLIINIANRIFKRKKSKKK